jgi:Cft2 family RNA processing exonuclease
MHITFFGAAVEVTGSCYFLTTSHARVLIDCGMFQGSPEDDQRNQWWEYQLHGLRISPVDWRLLR